MAFRNSRRAWHMTLAVEALERADAAAAEDLPVLEAAFLRTVRRQFELAGVSSGSGYKDVVGRYALLHFTGHA